MNSVKRKPMEIVVVVSSSRETRLGRAKEFEAEGYTLVDADALESDKLSQYVVYARTQGVKPVVVCTAGTRVAADAIYGGLSRTILVPLRIEEVDG